MHVIFTSQKQDNLIKHANVYKCSFHVTYLHLVAHVHTVCDKWFKICLRTRAHMFTWFCLHASPVIKNAIVWSNHLELVCIKQYLFPHTLLSVHFFIVGIVMQHAIFCPPPYQFVGLCYWLPCDSIWKFIVEGINDILIYCSAGQCLVKRPTIFQPEVTCRASWSRLLTYSCVTPGDVLAWRTPFLLSILQLSWGFLCKSRCQP